MPKVEVYADFRFIAENLDSGRIQDILQVDDAQVSTDSGRFSSWTLSSGLEPGASLDEHIQALLTRLLPIRSLIQQVAENFVQPDLFCSIYLEQEAAGRGMTIDLSRATIQAMSEFGLQLQVDVSFECCCGDGQDP